MEQKIPLKEFIKDYVEGEPLTIDTVEWAIRKYIYMNYEPTQATKLEMYENVFYEIARLLDGNQPEEVRKLLTNIRNWAYARKNSPQELEAWELIAVQNETFYNLLKTR